MASFLGRGPRISEEQKKRIPPGQYFTEKWPVLHYGSVPRVDLKTWDFKVWGDVENPFELSWAEFKEMPRKSLHTDIHCVTRWSRLDMDFEGVPIQDDPRTSSAAPDRSFRGDPRRAGLHDQPADRGSRRRRRDARRHRRRSAADAGPRLPAPARRSQALLLEERQVGARPAVHSRSTSPASGSATATTTTPTPGRKSASPTTDASPYRRHAGFSFFTTTTALR